MMIFGLLTGLVVVVGFGIIISLMFERKDFFFATCIVGLVTGVLIMITSLLGIY